MLSNHDREIEQWSHILQETCPPNQHSSHNQPSLLSIHTTSTPTMQANCTCPESNCTVCRPNNTECSCTKGKCNCPDCPNKAHTNQCACVSGPDTCGCTTSNKVCNCA